MKYLPRGSRKGYFKEGSKSSKIGANLRDSYGGQIGQIREVAAGRASGEATYRGESLVAIV
jgi:hypothetical protein